MADDDSSLNDQLPLRGVVLCCTSLTQDERIKLSETATCMGAVHLLDLTAAVTHLIVGNINTPKYRYTAKDRQDIKVLHKDFVEAVRQAWTDGEEVNVHALEEQYRLGAFFGLKICLTGFDNIEQRNYIADTVAQEGAEYHGDLTKAVTHLIAAAPKGAKYSHAKTWKIQLVSWKWFEHSAKRRMTLEESLYHPELPVEEQGQGAITTTAARGRTSLGKRSRDGESAVDQEPGKRKLRRTASTRLHSQSQDMLQDLSMREGTSEPSEIDQWKDRTEPQAVESKRPNLVQVQVRRSNVFSTDSTDTLAPEGVFAGVYVLVHAFPRDRASRLQQFLEPNGACVVRTAAELESASQSPYFKCGCLLMPHAFEGEAMEPPEIPPGTEIVTEWWVERCIHYKRYFDPADDALSRPFWDAKIPDFTDLSICTTGFSGVDFRQTAEAIKLLGAPYEGNLSPSVSVLVCGSENVKKEKAYYAAKHNISVVSVAWLWESLREKRKQDYDEYKVTVPAFDQTVSMREPSTSSPAPTDMLQGNSSRVSEKHQDAPTRLSNTRMKRATPSLPMQPRAAARPKSPKRGPFVHEDDDEAPLVLENVTVETATLTPAPELSPRRSRPLQERSPNASPRKLSQFQDGVIPGKKLEALPTTEILLPKATTPPTSPKSALGSPAKEAQQPPHRPREAVAADLEALLHRQTSSRPGSASSEPQKRKQRPLGRSASGIGHCAVSASAQSEHAGSPALSSSAREAAGSAADGFMSFRKESLPPPGTQLGYEAADAEVHRQLMEKRMKVSLKDESNGKRVASLGTVKDSFSGGGDAGAGVGNRVRGRNRTKT